MSTVARRREALLLRYMYRYNKDFAPEGTRLWYDYDQEYSIEGGDVLVLSKDIVAIGLSQRTTAGGIERFAENILKESSFQKILVFDIPKSRAFMHLDTVFTMVDYDKFTIHPEIEGPLQIYEITLSGDGKAHFESIQGELEDIDVYKRQAFDGDGWIRRFQRRCDSGGDQSAGFSGPGSFETGKI